MYVLWCLSLWRNCYIYLSYVQDKTILVIYLQTIRPQSNVEHPRKSQQQRNNTYHKCRVPETDWISFIGSPCEFQSSQRTCLGSAPSLP